MKGAVYHLSNDLSTSLGCMCLLGIHAQPRCCLKLGRGSHGSLGHVGLLGLAAPNRASQGHYTKAAGTGSQAQRTTSSVCSWWHTLALMIHVYCGKNKKRERERQRGGTGHLSPEASGCEKR